MESKMTNPPIRSEVVGSAGGLVSAVAWKAIIAGGFAAASITIVMAALGAGLGLTTISFWRSEGVSAEALSSFALIWLVLTQWFSAGLGGYLTGRLRTRWPTLHSHEVFFRDTVHGFLAWALATVAVALIISSTAVSAISGGARAAGSITAGAAQGAADSAANRGDRMRYFTDALFRSDSTTEHAVDQNTRGEATRILVTGLQAGDVPAADRSYLAQVIAAKTGVSEADAQKHVDDEITQIKAAEDKAHAAADKTRKAAATLALFTALAMVIGAFIASASAALGGWLRDEP